MEKESLTCGQCAYCHCDNRSHTYTRPPMYFCKKKGAFFSRNYAVGEKTRIEKEQVACGKFKAKE